MSSSIITLTSIFIFITNKNKSPFFMNLGMILLIFTLAMWVLFTANKWLFSVTIIFYLGGMMILFAYIISLSKSKHVFFQNYFWHWFSILPFVAFLSNITPNSVEFVFKSYSTTSCQFIFFLAVLLLLLLISVNKICMAHNGPLSSKTHDT